MKGHAEEVERSTVADDAAQACYLDEANPAVDEQLASQPHAAQAPAPRPPLTLERGVGESRRALQLTQLVRETLLPAYRRAVDAVDPMAAAELATHIVSAYRVRRPDPERARQGIPARQRDALDGEHARLARR